MNWLRYALITGICVVCYLLFLEWNTFEQRSIAEKRALDQQQETIASNANIDDTPKVPSDSSVSADDLPDLADSSLSVEQAQVKSDPVEAKASLISVKTDTLTILIDSYGGDIVRVELPQHLASRDNDESGFVLMKRSPGSTYVAQSGLIGNNGTDKSSSDRPLYQSRQNEYLLNEGENSLSVDLVFEQAGVSITKRFTFTRDSYLIALDYIIDNRSSELWSAAPYGQIRRNDFEVASEVGIGMQPYLGAAITTDDKNYDKYSFEDIADKSVNIKKTGGWVSMVQHYFISAWVPDQDSKNSYTLKRNTHQDLYILEYLGPITHIAPGTQGSIHSAFYVGPKNLKVLQSISPYLDLTLDYSWLSFIAKPLFYGLDFIHDFVGNWGVAILLLTFFIKLLFFYPSAISYRSMAKMRALQPMIADLKERCGDDRQKMSMETMKLYKKEKVNPLSGCLPIVMQMPVFIALYWVLMESVELRHAPFALWIQDLSVRDPFFLLPIIMGVTMFIQQKLNPPPTDPMQAKVMQMLPIFFTFLFLMFPAGLVLYWVANNTLSIIQQYIITRQIERSINAAKA